MPLHTRYLADYYRSQVAGSGTPSSGWLGAVQITAWQLCLPHQEARKRCLRRHPAGRGLRASGCQGARVWLQLVSQALEGVGMLSRCICMHACMQEFLPC